MNSRAQRILQMIRPENTKVNCKKEQQLAPAVSSYNIVRVNATQLNDSLDSDSIPDSQPGFSSDFAEDSAEGIISTNHQNKPNIIIKDSESDSDSSSSISNCDFSSADSVKDPDFKASDSESNCEEKSLWKPGPSRTLKNKLSRSSSIQPSSFECPTLSYDVQPTNINPTVSSVVIDAQEIIVNKDSRQINADIDSQPSSVIDNQPPSVDSISHPSHIDSVPGSVDSQSLIIDSPPRAFRKRKSNPVSWKKNISKKLKNSGKSYTSLAKSKKVIPERRIGPTCSEKCKFECTASVNNETREMIFQEYWNLSDIEMQRQFICNNISKIKPKYRYTRVGSFRINHNFAYYLPQNNTRTRVCKFFFINTLGISDKTTRTVIKKITSTIMGVDLKDNRGKHDSHIKLDSELREGVKAHINSIPRIENHYCRASTSREYIEGGVNITTLHRDYVEDCKCKGVPHVAYPIYYQIFSNDFNISFWKPKKDQCDDCTAFTNAENKAVLQEKHDQHIKEKNLARAEKEHDKASVSKNLVVAVYDLQATMPCPQGEVSSFYYISKLNVLNFTVTELGTNHSNCYVWHEGEGGRGVNELGSCVLMYLNNLNDKAEEDFEVIFYSDNCCGQQKNKFMLAMYQFAVNKYSKVQRITHKFLIKGHTQNEADAVHATIQRNISRALKCSPVYVPSQYITLIKTAKRGTPYTVKELSHDSFYDLKSLITVGNNNYTKTEDGEKVKWVDIKVMSISKNEQNKFIFKTSYEEEEFKSVTLTRRLPKSNLPRCMLKKAYSRKLEISETKRRGILKLIEKDIIPKYYEAFYVNL